MMPQAPKGRRRRLEPVALLGALALLGGAGLLFPNARAADLDFYKDVHPFLRLNCIPCHNKTTTKAGLNMETPELIRKGGESGPGLIAGKGAESLVYQSAAHQGESVMPPKNNKADAIDLKPAQLALLKTWIDQGAKASVKQTEQIAWKPLPPGVHPIYSVALTGDGRWAACGRANQLFVYDLETRQLAAQLADPNAKDGSAHGDLVHSVHFSPDGNRLASGGFREVKIWRKEPPKNVVAALSTPIAGGALIAAGADAKSFFVVEPGIGVRVFDAVSGALLRTFQDAPQSGVRALCASPDAQQLALALESGVLEVWSVADGRKRKQITGAPGPCTLAWSRDGGRLAAGSNDKAVRVWDISGEGEPPAPLELRGSGGPISAMAAGATPDQLLVASLEGTVRVWSFSGAKVEREIKVPGCAALTLSPDAKTLATCGSDGSTRIFDYQNGKQLFDLRSDMETQNELAALELAAARAALEVAHHTGVIAKIEAQTKTLDVQTKKTSDFIATAKKELPDKQKAVGPARDARVAAEKTADEAAAALAAATNGKPDAALVAKNKEAVTKLATAVAAANSAIAAANAAENAIKDGEVQLTQIADTKTKNAALKTDAENAVAASKKADADAKANVTARKESFAKTVRPALALAFDADGRSVSVVFEDGKQTTWSAASGKVLSTLATGAPLKSAAVAPMRDGRFTALASDGSHLVSGGLPTWSLERVLGGAQGNAPFAGRVCAVRFSPDGKTLATGSGEPSRSGEVLLWDVASGKLQQHWKDRHNDQVLCLDFSPDGKRLVSGSADRLARVSEVADGKPVFLLEAHTHHVLGAAFRADGRVVATAGGDGIVNVWEMQSGERIKKIIGWSKEITSLQFLGATQKILTSSADNQVRAVSDEGAEIRAIAKLPDFMQAAAGASTAPIWIGGGEDSALRVWDSETGAELAVFKAPRSP